MAVSREYLGYVLEQLAALGGLSSRRMFGGVGLYCDEFFFALIAQDTLSLRVDARNRGDFTARGMGAFRPYADRPRLSMSELVAWARRSLEVAQAAAPQQRRRAARPGAPARPRRR